MNGLLKILTEIRPEFDFINADNYIEEGMLDSTDIILLIARMEEDFLIKIDGTDIIPENFKNLKSMEDLLRKYGDVA